MLDGWMSISNDIALKSAYKQGNNSVNNYQKDQLDESLKFVKNFRTAIDIGAHIGIMSYNMSPKFETVHAFEIQPDVYHCLTENLKTKNINNVKTYNVGIGDKQEKVDLNFSERKTFSTHVKPNSSGEHQVMPLDAYKFKDIDFIKIDAEGYEPLIALGALETIKRDKPVILFERKQHPERYGYERDSIIEILKPHGYRILKEFGRKNALIGCI
jgi:FkbM family methyltransferase